MGTVTQANEVYKYQLGLNSEQILCPDELIIQIELCNSTPAMGIKRD